MARHHHCQPALTDAQLAQLERALERRQALNTASMGIDLAHGFLTAVVSGPRLILPVEWLPIVLGGQGDDEDPAALQAWLTALYQDVVQDLEHGHYGPLIMHLPLAGDDPLPLPYGWCQGYVRGLNLHGEEAVETAGEDLQAAAWLTPIAAFLMYPEAQRLAPLEPQAHRQTAAELAGAVLALYRWWRRNETPATAG